MINLIPKEEKKRMTTDFYCRVLVLFLLMFGFSVFVASASLLPAYFISAIKDSISNTKLETQKNDAAPSSGEQALAVIKDMNNKLGLVENAEGNKFLISEKVINAVILKKTPNIKIIQILYQNDPILGKNINVLGSAPSREELLQFQQALGDDPAFKNVNLPISSFVKNSNIQFDLTLTPS